MNYYKGDKVVSVHFQISLMGDIEPGEIGTVTGVQGELITINFGQDRFVQLVADELALYEGSVSRESLLYWLTSEYSDDDRIQLASMCDFQLDAPGGTDEDAGTLKFLYEWATGKEWTAPPIETV